MNPRNLCARLPLFVLALAAAAFAAGCGGDTAHEGEGDDHAHEAGETDDGHGHAHAGTHGGGMVEIGAHLAHMEVLHDEAGGDLRVWVTDCDGANVTLDAAPVLNVMTDGGSVSITAEQIGEAWQFVHEALLGHPEQGRFRVKYAGKTFSPDLPHGDHDHGAAHGPHEGTVQPFHGPDGTAVGYAELKLHDDKGDLELWITTDEAITKPFDLPLAATVTVHFHPGKMRSVPLAVRNTDKNEDEDGTANNRDGMTNYFIFPGETGADATWLMGAEFSTDVSITFEKDGKAYEVKNFLLRPHTHGAGDHEHDDDDHDSDHE